MKAPYDAPGTHIWLPGDIVAALSDFLEPGEISYSIALRRVLGLPMPRVKEEKTGPHGRLKYDVTDLAVGEYRVFEIEPGKEVGTTNANNIKRSIKRYAKRSGKDFTVTLTTAGIMAFRRL